MFTSILGLFLSLVSVGQASPKEHQIRTGVCVGYGYDCFLLGSLQLEYANQHFVVGANSVLFLNNLYGKMYLPKIGQIKPAVGFHQALTLLPDEGGGRTDQYTGVQVSADMLFKRAALRFSVGHLLVNANELASVGEYSVAFSAMYNFRLAKK